MEDVVLLKMSSARMEKAPMNCQLRFTQAFMETLMTRLDRTSLELSTWVSFDSAQAS